MRLAVLFIVSLLISSCGSEGSFHRGYVITKSQQPEAESVIAPPAE